MRRGGFVVPSGGPPTQAQKDGPRIEITPTVAEYEQLCRDLSVLRKKGAATNTAAVIDAVHRAARGGLLFEPSRDGPETDQVSHRR